MGTFAPDPNPPDLPEMDPDDDEQELVVMEPPAQPTDVPIDKVQNQTEGGS